MRQPFGHARGVVAVVFVLGFVAEAQAAFPGGLLLQRRGSMYRIPAQPAIIDSSPSIDALKKALKALGSTDRDYDGHREKAVEHVGSAIRHLETPNAQGKSNAVVQKAAAGKAAVATKTATTPQAASDESLRKAKAILFSVHHQLTEHTSSRGQIRADADIRIAISEIVAALNPPPAAKAAATPAPATATTTRTAPSTTPARPAR